jgi:hypothetical protein
LPNLCDREILSSRLPEQQLPRPLICCAFPTPSIIHFAAFHSTSFVPLNFDISTPKSARSNVNYFAQNPQRDSLQIQIKAEKEGVIAFLIINEAKKAIYSITDSLSSLTLSMVPPFPLFSSKKNFIIFFETIQFYFPLFSSLIQKIK